MLYYGIHNAFDSVLLEITSVNRGLRGKKKKDLTKKLVKSYMVGNIDFMSNQMIDFLSVFITRSKTFNM